MIECYKYFFDVLFNDTEQFANGIGCVLLGIAAITIMVWAIYQGGGDD